MSYNKLTKGILKYTANNKSLNDILINLSISTTFRRLASGSFWNAILNLYGKGISFIGTIIIIRLIGRDAFGEFGMVNTTISMFGMFTTFSISQTATKYIAQYRNSDKEKAGRIIGLSFLFSAALGFTMFALVMIFAKTLANYSLHAPHLVSSLQLMAIGLLFGSVNGAQNGVIAGFEAFKANTIWGVILGTINVLIKVTLTWFYGFKGAVIGMTIEPVLTYSATYFLTRKIINKNQITIQYKGAIRESGILLNYSLPSILTGLLVFPTNWYSMSLLTNSADGYHELGAYNAANQWYNVLIFIPYILVASFLPVFSEMLANNKVNEVNKIIKNAVYIVLAIFIPLTLVFLLFGEKIALIYGSQFKGTGFLLALAVFTLIPQGISIILGNLVAALNKMWFGLWVNFIWCIAIIGFTYLLLPYGSMGLLWARIIAFILNMMLMILFYNNIFKKKIK